ncbi:MAG TPA: DNA polymerase IV [Caldithrix abyssi]|uniref:DNA polymerase IV n=1 Tax=Caldithrix abyssi TaxID=187145 RepID=A0A7V5PMV9_CALAY|nr:DNA polymerase IV [Caldithrix abyssi]
MTRIILHVDMDAFFAAVEQRDHPAYRGKPVIVGADPRGGKGRGVVSTCSYEARKFGVHSAMPISQAYRLCPHGIYVPPNGKLYQQVSREIFEIFYEFTDAVEPLSIDEAFLDVTGSQRLFGSGEEIAKQIKRRIYQKERLTASVGVAPNKYLAKIASDLNKPDGLVVVEPDKVQQFLNPLDISRLWGAGERTQEKLRALGVRTIGDLARMPLPLLEQTFGKMGRHFYNLAHGIDDRAVEYDQLVKSVSNEHTFGQDTADKEEIHHTLFYLSEKVGYRLRKKGLKGRTVHLKLRYENFSTITRNKTLPNPVDNTEIIFATVNALFEQNYQTGRKVRLLGVGVSGFEEGGAAQLSLFDAENEKSGRLDELHDRLVERFGKKTVHRAESLIKPRKKKDPS